MEGNGKQTDGSEGKSGDALEQNVEYECFVLLTTYLGCTAVTPAHPLTPPPPS